MILNLTPDTDVRKQNFIDILGDLSIKQIIEDWQEVDLSPEEDAWIEYPPKEFLDFIRAYPETPFDDIPSSPNYLKTPSFLLTQAHRLWQTSSRAFKQLNELQASRFVDLGSFPFFLPLILRDYFGYKGEIIATINFDLVADHLSFLEKKQIQVAKLDLDPFVSDPAEDASNKLPITLNVASGSVDFVLATHVVEHLYHPRSLVKEAKRLLRPGGRLMITTDNAMMIDTFANYIAGYGYIFETMESTAAMTFNAWRGHVRFFTERDLTKLVEAEGFTMQDVDFFHCFYEVFFNDYFRNPVPRISGWKRQLLSKVPWMRNDIAIVAAL